jgi:DNA-binding transcriptional LysR family regulator
MTLQQLKYVVTVAEAGTITNAAKKLYIALRIC